MEQRQKLPSLHPHSLSDLQPDPTYDFYGRLLFGVDPPRSSGEYWSDDNDKHWFGCVWTRLPLVKRQRSRSAAILAQVTGAAAMASSPSANSVESDWVQATSMEALTAAVLSTSLVASDALAAMAAVNAAGRVAEDASMKARAAEEAAEKAVAAVKAEVYGSYPKATVASRGAAAMAARSTGQTGPQTAARPRSPRRVYERLSLRDHAVVVVAVAQEAADAAHESLKHMRFATEKAEKAAEAATKAALQAEAEWPPYYCCPS